jgi:predicted acylesterase/phospholipase RssA
MKLIIKMNTLTKNRVFFLILALLIASSAKAEAPAVPVSLTVSGGVSLGAYEAGYLYYTSRFIRENKKNSSLKLVTGASAGAINSLLTIMSACSSDQVTTPSESLFWKTWMPVGLQELLGTKENQKASAAFTAEALKQSAVGIEAAWMQGFDRHCDIVFGIATTLLKPSQVKLTDGIQAIHPEEPFVIRIQGRGRGTPPLITNYVDANDLIPHALLYLPSDERGKFLALQNLLLASAAFPGAFPPVKLKFCHTDFYRLHPTVNCTDQDAIEEYFIDGGVFDNEPLRLATRIATRGLKKEGKEFVWNEFPTLKNRIPPLALSIRALDVDAKTYPSEPQATDTNVKAEDEPLIPYFEKFVFRFVTSARSQQLYSVLDENPGLEGSIQSSKNNFPLASEPGLAFLGFFDRGFREYDFYMGMYDARRSALDAKENENKKVILLENLNPEASDWKNFSCLAATLDHTLDQEKLCAPPETANIRKLLQTSFDRLYNNCSKLDPKSDLSSFTNEDCLKAMQGDQPPRVSSDTNIENWKREKNEDEVLYSLRLLAQNHYHFETISDPNASPRETLVKFKTSIKDAFDLLASRQPKQDHLLLDFVGEPAFNLISYSPPEKEYHFLLGELVEGGGSIALNDWIRVHGAITIRKPQDIFTAQHGDFAIAPLLGFEIEPQFLSGAVLQPRLGLRAGYQFTPRDSWGYGSCISGSDCSRLVVEPYLATTVYERIRLQLAEEILPASRGQTANFDFFIQLGIEFTP